MTRNALFASLPVLMSVVSTSWAAPSDTVAMIIPIRSLGKQHIETPARPGVERFRKIPPGGRVCVNPVQNLSGKTLDMSGIDDALAAQIREIGFKAGSPGTLGICDATVYTEIVHIRGRRRVHIEIEFRLVLSGEQVPRLCSRATGKRIIPLAKFANSLIPIQHDRDIGEREALLASFTEQALQIEAAQTDGMELYAGAVQQ
jgi:hypothetical protein